MLLPSCSALSCARSRRLECPFEIGTSRSHFRSLDVSLDTAALNTARQLHVLYSSLGE